MLTVQDKLKDFPTINLISLNESSVRRAFMSYQFELYGIKKYKFNLVERFTKISQNYKLTGPYIDFCKSNGTTISHLNSMRDWYLNTTEEYGYFGDDDFTFDTVQYWNFTWNDILERMPPDWDGLQLIRVDHELQDEPGRYGSELKLLLGRWWGISCVLKRDYVRRLLEKTMLGMNHIHLECGDHIPIAEDILFLNGRVYNLPLIFDNCDLPTTYTDKPKVDTPDYHKYCKEYFLNLWTPAGIYNSIDDIMKI